MAAHNPIQSETVKRYLSRFPDTPNAALARKIYMENPSLFKDAEIARSRVRYYRGQSGKKHRKEISEKKYLKGRAENANKLGIPNPYGLPESHEQSWEPFELPRGKKYGVLSDIHIPYHNISALNAALEHCDKVGVDAIVLNGDTIDMHQLSRFIRDPRLRSFAQELEDVRNFLKALKDNFDVPVYFKLGNHGERYENFLKVKAPELLDIQEFKLDVLLRFAEYNCHYIADKRRILAGKLNIMHGHEAFSTYSPVNPAKGHYNRTYANVMVGHHHQSSEHTERTLDQKLISAWSTGCLCELHPMYMPINRWNHGFAIVNVDKDGSFQVDNMRIYNGKIL